MILNHFKKQISLGDWGKVLNALQDIAGNVLTSKEMDAYTRKSCKDVASCVAMDGMYINGRYFDWKEFTSKSKEIVNAWLDYFSDKQIAKIANAIEEKKQ